MIGLFPQNELNEIARSISCISIKILGKTNHLKRKLTAVLKSTKTETAKLYKFEEMKKAAIDSYKEKSSRKN